LPKEFDDPAYSTVTIQRDLFYGYDTLMENVSDPSHIEFAHHKVNAVPVLVFENAILGSHAILNLMLTIVIFKLKALK
jgi:hypothetical protein